MNPEFEALLKDATPSVEELARKARELILGVMPQAHQTVWLKQDIISFGIGPKKMSEHFCYVAVFKERINLGFYYGADLKDPAGLLEGTGKALRHIKVATVKELERAPVLELIKSSSTYFPKLKGR